MVKVICVCGARPNFMKIAPLVESLRAHGGFDVLLLHTGQHYDRKMSRLFFDELGIPEPDINLEVGSASHAVQTGEIMKRFEPVCQEHKPDWVIVVGDVNSTVACSLVAVKMGIRVAHVEAGLRSFDRTMPEEINRLMTDAISDLLFVTEPSAVTNLEREGIEDGKVKFVGNVMIDTLMRNRAQADRSTILHDLELAAGGFGVVTLHRPANVDDEGQLGEISAALNDIAGRLPLVFPMHPRTRASLERFGSVASLFDNEAIRVIEPLGYLDFLKLIAESAVVLTDSGGIQEETTVLGVPCITMRSNTERPVTLTKGTNRLAGTSGKAILAAFEEAISSERPHEAPELWDGRAAERIVAILAQHAARHAI
ncbi:MAG: non-hydrolyzing UDP-N-acetylglucosamine 2-epimerase [Planctomycetota bacterium]